LIETVSLAGGPGSSAPDSWYAEQTMLIRGAIMDAYTLKTRDWLNKRFGDVTEDGVYIPHQPIYGFRVEPGPHTRINRYAITWQLMKTLAEIAFESVLDVGCAEGYKTAMVRDMFNVQVRGADLSSEACRRAREIFDVAADEVDICRLPYRDNSFDVVMCSEVLEHVPESQQATQELYRVCRRAVVITIPLEPERVAAQNRVDQVLHSHIHAFDRDGNDFTHLSTDFRICNRFHHVLMQPVNRLADGIPRTHPLKFRHRIYNCLAPVARLLVKNRAAAWLIKLDGFLANRMGKPGGLTIVLLKDPNCLMEPKIRITPKQVIDYVVPVHRPAPRVNPGATGSSSGSGFVPPASCISDRCGF